MPMTTIPPATTPEVATRLHVHRDAAGRPRLTAFEGPIAARVTGNRADGLDIALLSTTATLLGGDDVRLDVRVAAGLRVTLTDIAATVAYDGRGAPAAWTAVLDVGAGASLLWRAEPFVVADGADVTRTTSASLADGAALTLQETLVLGRSGERGGAVTSEVRVDLAGAPLLRERVRYAGDPAGQRFLRGDARVLTTRMALGTAILTPEAGDDVVLELAGPGRVARRFR